MVLSYCMTPDYHHRLDIKNVSYNTAIIKIYFHYITALSINLGFRKTNPGQRWIVKEPVALIPIPTKK